jgi:SAM-dependent methyltransferase
MLTFEFIDPDRQIGSDDFQFVERFLISTGRTEIGWHYITDIAWIYSKVKNWPRTYRVLDAGGGSGPLQFLLAELGFQVTNIDMVLPEPAPADMVRYSLTHRRLSHFTETGYAGHLRQLSTAGAKPGLRRVYRRMRRMLRNMLARLRAAARDPSVGKIEWVTGNLCDLREIPTGTFDAVVSLSAIEHIPLEQLGTALAELSRVLKPKAPWAVTTSGTEQPATWLHEPSQGWCYSVSDLNKRFGATGPGDQDPASLLERYRRCAYLKEHLAGFYLRTERSGMPLGVWDPRYIPVGLSR